mgnify:CR=1 FL=1
MSKIALATRLIVEIFRLHSALIVSGDRLVADLGLTSARWQVLAAMVMRGEPAPVVRLAEDMGLARQSVQRIVNELEQQGALRFAANPRHRRAKLVVLTPAGRALFDAAMRLQAPWARRLVATVRTDELEGVANILAELRTKLERGGVGRHG